MSFTRRNFLRNGAAFAASASALPSIALSNTSTHGGVEPTFEPLTPPKNGPIKVAFLISDDFAVIDFAGPWEIFGDVANPHTQKPAFTLYTVSRTGKPVKAMGGLTLIPEYSFDSAPKPDVLVIPAQADDSEPILAWIREASKHTSLTMSVCTGAFLLAKAGMLNGLKATTHHGAYKLLAVNYPHIHVREEVRFVDNGHIATAGGLSAGIDLALHVVARYFGSATAGTTAAFVEYAGYGWKNPHDTGDLFTRLQAEQKGRVCPVCGMGPIGTDIALLYRGKTYYFCSENCRATFVKRPDVFLRSHSDSRNAGRP